ncbi:NAD-dependent succinate-semialdehyde dehydrogenase [Marinobacterium sp. AK62]|uniref:NAD-dependent succinate-semialdehyde dehydrogenase n=1 Tax=Marinobacterium alkalitolerans TaxID=1542925 RepID=A0ABS3ZBC7_9GAMM|nr:NAD-dependent succinate-semialdehyde dehydrogenase [Marinobacterium alkalitolerans]MBP0048992.1 NAD-dependent succinate-semialdehyde dehydrogenase [Marinobacterium alkalitolerans]
MELKDKSLLREQAYVNGQWVGAQSGQTFAVLNPATRQEMARVPLMSEPDAEAAVEAAEAAFASWRKTTAKERAGLLRRWYELMHAHLDDLALLMTLEQGKPLAEARGEVQYAASFVEWFAEEGKRAYGELIPTHKPDARILVNREPVGVVAAITPWNFPAAMITRKAAPALAAGCTFVCKPAEDTPLTALALAELAERAGIPAGVFNIVTGDPKALGSVMTGDARVRKLSFTGSTPVGKLLMAQCADTVKRVSLELGGNAPFIAFDDADLERALDGAMASKYRNTGQTCVCTNRFIVQAGIYDQFVEGLAKRVSDLKVGSGLEEGVQQGPLINQAAVDKVETHIEDAVAKGAQLVCGGKPHALGGTWFEPTVLRDVTPDMKVATEETFGPLAPVFRFTDEQEAVAMANATEYGLAAYFYSRDLGRCWRVGEALEYGMVGINEGIISTEVAPFGGVKASGLGREGARQGLEEYLECKYMLMGGI